MLERPSGNTDNAAEIAEFINEEKRIAENMNHILEIENRLTQRNREGSM